MLNTPSANLGRSPVVVMRSLPTSSAMQSYLTCGAVYTSNKIKKYIALSWSIEKLYFNKWWKNFFLTDTSFLLEVAGFKVISFYSFSLFGENSMQIFFLSLFRTIRFLISGNFLHSSLAWNSINRCSFPVFLSLFQMNLLSFLLSWKGSASDAG